MQSKHLLSYHVSEYESQSVILNRAREGDDDGCNDGTSDTCTDGILDIVVLGLNDGCDDGPAVGLLCVGDALGATSGALLGTLD